MQAPSAAQLDIPSEVVDNDRDRLLEMSVMIGDSEEETGTEFDYNNQSVMDESVFQGYARPPIDKDDINK